MKQSNFRGAVNERRIQSLKRLEMQLKSKMKQPRGTVLVLDMVPLEEKDIERIKNEINILKSRITSDEVARNTRHKIYRGPQ